jgi:hypothetical protein
MNNIKLYQLKTFQNRLKFTNCARNWVDLLILHKILLQYPRQNLLEIGYNEGLSFGILYESSPESAKITTCDITYERDVTRQFLHIEKECNFIKCDAAKLKFSNKFDFIFIDGQYSHSEFDLAETVLDTNSIVLFDRPTTNRPLNYSISNDLPSGIKYHNDTKNRAVMVNNFINHTEFVPFLAGPAFIFCCHPTFLSTISKTDLTKFAGPLAGCSKENWQGFIVDSYTFKLDNVNDKILTTNLIEKLNF